MKVQDPELRLRTIEAAGQASVPYTSGLLIGIGETREERVHSLLDLRALHNQYGHIQVSSAIRTQNSAMSFETQALCLRCVYTLKASVPVRREAWWEQWSCQGSSRVPHRMVQASHLSADVARRSSSYRTLCPRRTRPWPRRPSPLSRSCCGPLPWRGCSLGPP